jgi:hypothetical protein
MSLKSGNQGEAGSITLIATIVMVTFGILLAGLLPFVTHTGVSAAYSVRSLQAHYAAEAGAKRAIVGFQQQLNDWDWANNSGITLATGNPSTYSVSINPAINAGNAPTTGTEYTITSVGRVGNQTRKITILAKINTSTSDTPTTFSFPDAAIAAGGTVKIQKNACVTINGDIVSKTSVPETNNNSTFNGSHTLSKNSDLVFPVLSSDFINAFKSDADDFPIISSGTQNLTKGKKYYHSGDVSLYSTQTITYTASGGTAVVLIDGDLKIDGDKDTQQKFENSILLIVTGKVQIKGNGETHIENSSLIVGDPTTGLEIKDNAVFNLNNGQLIALGNLELKNITANININYKDNSAAYNTILGTTASTGSGSESTTNTKKETKGVTIVWKE